MSLHRGGGTQRRGLAASCAWRANARFSAEWVWQRPSAHFWLVPSKAFYIKLSSREIVETEKCIVAYRSAVSKSKIIFHGVYVPQLPYPFVCWWASRLLPCPGCDKRCCDEHWGARVSLRSGFLGVYAQQWDCWVIWQLWYIDTMEYYSTIKKNSFESFLMRWMKLEPIIQSEVSQKDKGQYSILTHIYGI